MIKIVRSALGIVAILLLTTPLCAQAATLSAQQRLQKAQSTADTLTKALQARGYRVKRVGPARPMSTFHIPNGVTCTTRCTFVPPICSVTCKLI